MTVREKKSVIKSVTKTPRRLSKRALIDRFIRSFQNRLESDEVKGTIGDFIRLIQLEQEIRGEQPREVTVTWVDPQPTAK